MLTFSGCGSNGGLSKLEVDDTIQTGSLPDKIEQNPTQTSDASIIRNAVSAVDMSTKAVAPLNWANQETGSTGTITDIRESKGDGILCRDFKTSRESFEGVAMYAGSTCLNAEKQWFVRSFVAL
jgi:17 kDa outer membrane surface antigen